MWNPYYTNRQDGHDDNFPKYMVLIMSCLELSSWKRMYVIIVKMF